MICHALGMDAAVFTESFRDVPLFRINWMVSQLDLQLLSLVRALICLPKVLLVHPFQEMTPSQASKVRGVLTNFVQGRSVHGLSCLPRSSYSSKPRVEQQDSPCLPRRTVLWITDKDTMASLRDLEVPTAELQVVPTGGIEVTGLGDGQSFSL
eukprot:TRINITY_DN74061_c0_g1_i1.p1 TRINITY_DN74061_c0_g1~~TRINITY_DN74061_c0_g1_i1.p1  ORF type:complete len:153 (-),score=17.48 TRINITY_DN74061_c0_g1_i1:31-489(-)